MGGLISCLNEKDDPTSKTKKDSLIYIPSGSDWWSGEGSPPPRPLTHEQPADGQSEDSKTDWTSAYEKTSVEGSVVNPLELPTNTPLDRLEQLLQLGRLHEAAELAQKLPINLMDNVRVQFCLAQRQQVEDRRRSLESLDGWRIQVDGNSRGSDGISIHYRFSPGSRILELRSSFKVNSDFLPIRSLRAETSLWPLFLGKHLTIETTECATRGWTDALCSLLVYLPWPMKKREAYLKLHMYDMIAEDGYCLWWGEDLGEREEFLGFTIPEASSDIVRALGKLTGIEKMVSKGVIELILVCQIDLQMVLPQWLVNFITRKVGWHAAKQFKDMCTNLPQEHQQKIVEDRTGVYSSLKERSNSLLSTMQRIPENSEFTS